MPRLPPTSTAPSRAREDVADQRGRRRFAVGAGDSDIARVRLSAAQQFDIADDLGAGLARPQHGRMRLGKAVRDAGRQHQRRECCANRLPSDRAAEARAAKLSRTFALSSQARTSAPPAASASTRRARIWRAPARATGRPRKLSTTIMTNLPKLPYRSFSVARPAIARIAAMIQKRMTMVGSSQPFCSK